MTYPHLHVTSGIVAAPSAVLADLNDLKPMMTLHSGLDLGEAGGDERELTLIVELEGDESSKPRAISRMIRAFNTPGAHVKWQAMASHEPTWWRIVRDVTRMDFSDTIVNDPTRAPSWRVAVSLQVAPYGMGALRTLDPVTVYNALLGYAIDPIDIAGDVPAPARIQVRPLGVQDWGNWRTGVGITPVLTSCPLGAPAGVLSTVLPPVITWQAEAFTADAGTTSVYGAGLSGGSGVGFDENDGTWRRILYGPVPVTPPPGQYAVWVRLSRSQDAGGARLRLGHLGWQSPLDNRVARWSPPVAEPHISWLYLGEQSYPAGMAAGDLTTDDITSPAIQLHAQGFGQGSPSGKIVVDRFALVPVRVTQGGEGRFSLATWGVAGPVALENGLWNGWRNDSRNEAASLENFERKLYASVIPPRWQGGWPEITPGMRNIVTFLPRTNTAGTGSDSLTAQAEVVVSYYPLFEQLAW